MLSLAFSFNKKNSKRTPPNFLFEYSVNLLSFSLKLEYFSKSGDTKIRGKKQKYLGNLFSHPSPYYNLFANSVRNIYVKKNPTLHSLRGKINDLLNQVRFLKTSKLMN